MDRVLINPPAAQLGRVNAINDDEQYTITVDSLRPVETFCGVLPARFRENGETAAGAARYHRRS